MKYLYGKVKNILREKVPEGGLLWHLLVFPQRFQRHKLRIFMGYWEGRETKRMAEPLKKRRFKKGHVSIVMNSAGRKEYLERTIEALKKYFQYDPQKTHWLIIDDYPDSKETREYIKSLDFFDCVIFNERNRGLGYSINRIFAEVQTEFVFYCQEDYEVLRPFSVKQMIRILRENPQISQLMLLGTKKYVGMQRKTEEYSEYYRMFGFWPYLASMDFFVRVLPFPFYFTAPEFTFKVKRMGYHVFGILGNEGDLPYVRHIGEERKILVVK